MNSIPIVDFSPAVSDEPRDSEGYRRLVDDIHAAFSNIGFTYLKNHGIKQEQIDKLFQVSRSFFSQPIETKMKYFRPKGLIHGYVHTEREKLNPERPVGDFNESFNYAPWSLANPQAVEVPNFDAVFSDLFKDCSRLLLQILEVMGRGLQLDDPLLFVKAHQKIGSKGNETFLRSLFYPPVHVYKKGQLRCGEHSDFGSITLLFQSQQKGLEVMNREGQYVQAIPIEGTLLINIGDLMQRWTSDRLVSSRHRVLMPDPDKQEKSFRQSIPIFARPDDGVMISCIDGSNKYPPITSENYMQSCYDVIYKN